jgi:hypothetical protein
MATGLYMASLTDGEEDIGEQREESSVSRSGFAKGDSFLGIDISASKSGAGDAVDGDGDGMSWFDFLKEAGKAKGNGAPAAGAPAKAPAAAADEDDDDGDEIPWEQFLAELAATKAKGGGKA